MCAGLYGYPILLGYVRFVYDGVVSHEELEMALSLNTDTRGETVF